MQALSVSQAGRHPDTFMPWLARAQKAKPVSDLVKDYPMLFPAPKEKQ